MVESKVVCFFQPCQAAGLGTQVIGKKGQPTRLRLDREELEGFNAGGRADATPPSAKRPPPGGRSRATRL
jgi:hypothetical protein